MKSKVFAIRTWKEIMRDPLSYIFCLGFPLVMLVIMSIIDKSIPAEAGMQVFRIRNLAPGIAYFAREPRTSRIFRLCSRESLDNVRKICP